MRKEPFFVGDFVQVFNRGNRKQEIVRDEKDRQNFLLGLYYLNNEESPSQPIARAKEFLNKNSRSNLENSRFDLEFGWPDDWGERKPLVKILAFILLENHLHLILEEIKEGGIAKFMGKLGNSMTGYFNEKYSESGRLFQGSYKARRVDDDNYLRYLAAYVMVKNAFEMYPGGIENAMKNFDDAYDFAIEYPYSSLAAYAGGEVSPIIDTEMLKEAFPTPQEMKEFAKGCMDFVYFVNIAAIGFTLYSYEYIRLTIYAAQREKAQTSYQQGENGDCCGGRIGSITPECPQMALQIQKIRD